MRGRVRDAPWPDAVGRPIALPLELVQAHADGGGLTPLELAARLVVEAELQALVEADRSSLPGRLAAWMRCWRRSSATTTRSLFELLAPYRAAVEAMLPQVAGVARWLRPTERRNARAILNQFLALLRTGLDDPTRLGRSST